MTNSILLPASRKLFSSILWTGNQWECPSLEDTEEWEREDIMSSEG